MERPVDIIIGADCDQLAVALSVDGKVLAYRGGRESAIRLVDLDPD